MIDERALIARLEAAAPDELALLLARPSAEEERALRLHLGTARYQRLHDLALRSGLRRREAPRGNVVVIPGFMGSTLTGVDRAGDEDRLWVTAFHLVTGGLARLRLADDGRSERDPSSRVHATGILKRYYGELLLTLAERWTVRAFWYDWRKDLGLAADELRARLTGWFDAGAPVHLVAHGAGGLVARTFIANHADGWRTMWDGEHDGRRGGRLVLLGTPNHGSFATLQAIAGLDGIVKRLAMVDVFHDKAGLLQVLNSFVAPYQALPSPEFLPAMAPLYDAKTYGELNAPQRHLDLARRHHRRLRDVVDAERMVRVAGTNQPTAGGIDDLARLDAVDAYAVTWEGDGYVSHDLGSLKTPDGTSVPTYYVEEHHAGLPANDLVLAGIDALLRGEPPGGLSEVPPPRLLDADQARAGERLRRADAADDDRLVALAGRLRSRVALASPSAAGDRNGRRLGQSRTAVPAMTVGGDATPPAYVSDDERELEDLLLRGVLESGDATPRPARSAAPMAPARIAVALAHGSIDAVDALDVAGPPIDAIAVGHYVGVRPQAAELALDQAISRAWLDRGAGGDRPLPETDLILTQFTDRGTFLGELGRPFFLADPRGNGEAANGRLIAVAGMGPPGRFGTPELTVLARELCWALGRMGKRHLATVLIGAGNGNLSARDAVAAWLRGVEAALTGSVEDAPRRLERLTFVEFDPGRIPEIEDAIVDERARLKAQCRLTVAYTPFAGDALKALAEKARARERDGRRRPAPGEPGADPVPTRVTLELERETYRFGAITETAAVPARAVRLDPKLVTRANDELAAEWDPAMQLEAGIFLERLLLPAELRAHLVTDAPLVMVLDATTARIHWEMVAQPDPLAVMRSTLQAAGGGLTGGGDQGFDKARFLGTSRGLTRQLLTGFAPLPEPPPPPRRLLRVLVVADPAEDAHLPGAEEEGGEVAALFEAFNRVYDGVSENRIEVVRLFGPREATRTRLLKELTLRSYDVLHFAGHCLYDRDDPAASGWIFSGGERLSANELNRVDRIPKFVFSNACESGITPDRSELRSVELAPSFAEAFFGRGVANFVCTAWPVDDVAARQFAATLYAALLGLPLEGDVGRGGRVEPRPMHAAMREARVAVAETPNGARTWGAYQHYGNPFFRLFAPPAAPRTATARQPGAADAATSADRSRSKRAPTDSPARPART